AFTRRCTSHGTMRSAISVSTTNTTGTRYVQLRRAAPTLPVSSRVSMPSGSSQSTDPQDGDAKTGRGRKAEPCALCPAVHGRWVDLLLVRGGAQDEPREPLLLLAVQVQPVDRLADAVTLARVAQELDRLLELLERAEVLLALRDRHAAIVLAVGDEERRRDALRILDRRPLLVRLLRFRRHPAEPELEQVRNVRLAEERIPVVDAGVSDCCLEAVGQRDGPDRNESAVAADRDRHPLRIGDAECDDVVDAVHDVDEVLAAPVVLVGVAE